MDKPLVSIHIISFNQVNFISQAIENAIGQNYPNIEVVVADDASSDGTAQVILDYAKRYPGRIVPIISNINLGITANSNRALRKCRGKYIAFQGGDDYFLPGKITAQVECMEANNSCVLSYHDVEVFESVSGKMIRKWSDIYRVREEGAKEVVLYGTFMAATSVMINREMCPDIWFDPQIPITSDWLFWIEMLAASKGKIAYVSKIYARHRRHDQNITSTREYVIDELNMTLDIIEAKYPELSVACNKKRSESYLMKAVIEFSAGRICCAISSVLCMFSPTYYYGVRSIEVIMKKILGVKR